MVNYVTILKNTDSAVEEYDKMWLCDSDKYRCSHSVNKESILSGLQFMASIWKRAMSLPTYGNSYYR